MCGMLGLSYIGTFLQNFLISFLAIKIVFASEIDVGTLFQILDASPTKLDLAITDFPVSIMEACS